MKVLPSFLSLFLLNVAFAAPSANSEAFPDGSELRAFNQTALSADSHPVTFEKRVTAAQCISVAKAFWARTSLEVANIFVTKTSNYIKSVCERHNKEECALWVDDVRDGFQLIFDLGYVYKVAAAAADAHTSYINNARRSYLGNDLPSNIEDVLKLHGYSYESIENVTLPSTGIKARDNEPALMSLYMLKSVRQAGGRRAHDYTIHNFEDGTAHLHVPYVHDKGSNSKPKRHDGAGVKISFKHKAIILATNADKKGASAALASKWLEYAESGNGEMFGFVEAMNEAVFYYRTIIEGNGFGEEYESVDDCGNLGQFVGTYLGPA